MGPSTAKNRLFLLLFGILLLPLLNQQLRFTDSGSLDNIPFTPNPVFTWKDWWDGTYQERKNKYINDSIGFRTDLVRLSNQIDFSILENSNGGIIIGSENHLFFRDYIDEYCGRDFNGTNYLAGQLDKLKFIQDTLERKGKTMVLVYAPSKAHYFSEHIPSNLLHYRRPNTLYKMVKRTSDSLGINQIDFNEWFLKLKVNTKHLLFAKQSLHWTVYGSLLAADSLIRYIEQKREIKMPHPKWEKTIRSSEARSIDNDLSRNMNLAIPFEKEVFSYPEIQYEPDSTKVKPKGIYITDSFIWPMAYTNVIAETTTSAEIWYYFKEAFGPNESTVISNDINNYDWQNAINNADYIVIMYTPKNLLELKGGFVEKAYEYFHGN